MLVSGEERYNLPILAVDDSAKKFTRHVMEAILLQEYSAFDNGFIADPHPLDLSYTENCFIVAGADLPRFCWAMMAKNAYDDLSLSQMTLAIEISYDMDPSAAQGEPATENQNNIKEQAGTEIDADNESRPKNENDTEIKNEASTNHEANTIDDADTKFESKNVNIGHDKVTDASSRLVGVRVRRLLEPFRRLQGLEAVHIEGPVSQEYNLPLIAGICQPEPSDEELFDRVLATIGDAISTYEAGHMSSAVTKIKYTLDAMADFTVLCRFSQGSRISSSPKGVAIRFQYHSITCFLIRPASAERSLPMIQCNKAN